MEVVLTSITCLYIVGVCLPLVSCWRDTARARRGSLVFAAARRRMPMLIAGGATILLFTWTTGVSGPSRVAAYAMAATLVVGLALDVRSWWRVGRGPLDATRLRVRSESSPPLDAETRIDDFGIGDHELEELAPPTAVYRERERVVRVVRGSWLLAREALWRFVFFDLVLCGLTFFMWLCLHPQC